MTQVILLLLLLLGVHYLSKVGNNHDCLMCRSLAALNQPQALYSNHSFRFYSQLVLGLLLSLLSHISFLIKYDLTIDIFLLVICVQSSVIRHELRNEKKKQSNLQTSSIKRIKAKKENTEEIRYSIDSVRILVVSVDC